MTRSGSLACALLAGLSIITGAARAQEAALIPDTSLPIPQLHFDSTGALLIKASPTSSVHDFDYLVGNWKLRNRKLKSRLTHSTEWLSFESRVEMHQILNGVGNIDKYTDTASGTPYEGVALRLFDTRTKLWSIYWADSNSGISIRRWSVRSRTGSATSLRAIPSRDRTSSSCSAGMREIRSCPSGARPSPRTKAKRGNGIPSTSRSAPGNALIAGASRVQFASAHPWNPC
jgi:hypothetical protein